MKPASLEHPQPFSHRTEKRGSFQVSFLEVHIPALGNAFDGYRMVQLTDLHFGPLTPIQHIKDALELARSVEPHLLLLTGDYVQNTGIGISHVLATQVHPKLFRWGEYRRKVRKLAAELSLALEGIRPPDGVVGVFGNHDYTEGLGTIRRQLPQHIRWLKNSSLLINHSGQRLCIAGLDDHRYGKPDLQKALGQLERGTANANLLLAHNPDVVTMREAGLLDRVHLILSGHTHGGQICLPGGIPLATRTKQRNYYRGPNMLRDTVVYVSNGVGYGGLPIRLFCPPEVTVITLRNLG